MPNILNDSESILEWGGERKAYFVGSVRNPQLDTLRPGDALAPAEAIRLKPIQAGLKF